MNKTSKGKGGERKRPHNRIGCRCPVGSSERFCLGKHPKSTNNSKVRKNTELEGENSRESEVDRKTLYSVEVSEGKPLEDEIKSVVAAIVGAVDRDDVETATQHLREMFQEIIRYYKKLNKSMTDDEPIGGRDAILEAVEKSTEAQNKLLRDATKGKAPQKENPLSNTELESEASLKNDWKNKYPLNTFKGETRKELKCFIEGIESWAYNEGCEDTKTILAVEWAIKMKEIKDQLKLRYGLSLKVLQNRIKQLSKELK